MSPPGRRTRTRIFRPPKESKKPCTSKQSSSSMHNRKLPVLSSALVVPVPVDEPVLHQGRIRTVPHVEGNWATHVYLSIDVDRSHALCSLLEAAAAKAKQLVPVLESLITRKDINNHAIELHISLSRPIFVRAHQKEELRRAVKKLSQHPPYVEHFPR